VIDILIDANDLTQLQKIAQRWVERALILLAYWADPSAYAVNAAVGGPHRTQLRCLRRALRFGGNGTRPAAEARGSGRLGT
jgi:hypothetical protein